MRVSAIWLCVPGLEEARRFYRDILGLKEDQWDEERGVLELSGEGGPPLYVRRNARRYQQAGVPGIGLKFDDLPALRTRLERAGVAIHVLGTVRSGHEIQEVLAFPDPYGHWFEAWPWALRDAVKSVAVAGVVIDRDGRVLLVRGSRGPWQLPGGVADEQEGPIAALEREFVEEIGAHPVSPTLCGVYHTRPYDGIRLTFRCDIDGAPAPASEIEACEFFHPTKRLDELAQPFIVDRIIDALEFTGQAFVREQSRDAAGKQLASRPRPW